MEEFSKSLYWILGIGVAIILLFFVLRFAQTRQEEQTRPNLTPAATESTAAVNDTTDVAPPVTKAHAFDLPTGAKGQIVDNGCYTICYAEAYEQPAWTSYVLDGGPMMKIKRENDQFKEDPDIETGSAVPADYRNSGYDRGHLVPAADMKRSRDCFEKSFLLSNISPQDHGFNTGLWRRLEESVRKWDRKRAPLQIVSGPILSKDIKKKIGKVNRIPVPNEYFKVIVHKGQDGWKAIGFLMPNKDSELSIEKFAVSVALIERRSGLDFNKSLPDSLERGLENTLDLKYWFN